MSELAGVDLWGTRIGAVLLEPGARAAVFQYESNFLFSGIEVSPITMPLSNTRYTFPGLGYEAFRGLPGLLADSLPDKFGRALIRAWLATQGRTFDSFSPIEQLCHVGARGAGALEYRPMINPVGHAQPLQVADLVGLANEILAQKADLHASFASDERKAALARILQTSSSAGGARAKAVIAWNPQTQEVRSGQADAPEGFEHWLLKFDGVDANRNDESRDPLADPLGYTVAEYVYSLMARNAGIQMSDCRLLEEGGRRHFMTRRFDRTGATGKLHMQTLGGLAHMDFNEPQGNTYETAFDVLHRLKLGTKAAEQLYRRMLFNVISHNHDDHVKNIAFLMDRSGTWQLAPAYDLAYNYNPKGWTREHQMSINGKRDDFTREDFAVITRAARIPVPAAKESFDAVRSAVSQWDQLAGQHEVPKALAKRISAGLRLDIR